jgi:hypothetical protein
MVRDWHAFSFGSAEPAFQTVGPRAHSSNEPAVGRPSDYPAVRTDDSVRFDEARRAYTVRTTDGDDSKNLHALMLP